VIFHDFPGPGILKKKIQDFPGGVGTLLMICPTHCHVQTIPNCIWYQDCSEPFIMSVNIATATVKFPLKITVSRSPPKSNQLLPVTPPKEFHQILMTIFWVILWTDGQRVRQTNTLRQIITSWTEVIKSFSCKLSLLTIVNCSSLWAWLLLIDGHHTLQFLHFLLIVRFQNVDSQLQRKTGKLN